MNLVSTAKASVSGRFPARSARSILATTAPDQLSWAPAALLAGLVQAPSADDPITHPDRAHAREQHVLARLVDTGQLTTGQADTAAAGPLNLTDRSPP